MAAPDLNQLKQQLAAADRTIEDLDRQVADKRAMLNLLTGKAQELEKELTASGVDITNLDAWIEKESKALLDEVERAKSEMSKINI